VTSVENVELFVLKCAAIERDLRNSLGQFDETALSRIEADRSLADYVKQFDLQNRLRAKKMSQYYELFYMLENDIRRIIADTLEDVHGANWWTVCVDQPIKDEVERNKKREAEAGISLRSDADIDYTTFGQLGDIIKRNWVNFAGMLSNQSALSRVVFQLNMLRAAIAHCGVLADDEVDRLKLTIKDWFRVLAGPQT
jgi:hypothetical protein